MDEIGTLADMKYSDKWNDWWGPEIKITRDEFERMWLLAGDSIGYQEQLKTKAETSETGEPIWITIYKKKHGT
jgi:hypothetical protein